MTEEGNKARRGIYIQYESIMNNKEKINIQEENQSSIFKNMKYLMKGLTANQYLS